MNFSCYYSKYKGKPCLFSSPSLFVSISWKITSANELSDTPKL